MGCTLSRPCSLSVAVRRPQGATASGGAAPWTRRETTAFSGLEPVRQVREEVPMHAAPLSGGPLKGRLLLLSDRIVDDHNAPFAARLVLRASTTLVGGRFTATGRFDMEWDALLPLLLTLSSDPVDDEGVEHADSSRRGSEKRGPGGSGVRRKRRRSTSGGGPAPSRLPHSDRIARLAGVATDYSTV